MGPAWRLAAVACHDDLPVVGGVELEGGGVEGGAVQVVGDYDVGRGVAGLQQDGEARVGDGGVVEVPGEPGVEALAGRIGGGGGIGEGGGAGYGGEVDGGLGGRGAVGAG